MCMSSHPRNNSIIYIKLLSNLFLKMIERTITSDEKTILSEQIKLLERTFKITHDEGTILFNILNKITSVESRQKITEQLPTLPNAIRLAKEQQLKRFLDSDEVDYLENIILKLQGELSTDFFINQPFPYTFPNHQSFQDFIMTKSYTNSDIIGKGGFGKVYLLNFPEHPFVLKEMILKNEKFLISVENEVKALKQVIGKWYAVQLLAAAIVIDENITLGKLGTAYILYPFIPGETLAAYQETEHPEEEERAIYTHIIEAVEQLHTETGLLHSDIKPENIWIPSDRRRPPFLLDFGLVQLLKNDVAKNSGTPFYWSEKRFHSKGKSKQTMTNGINWLALARTLGSELTNNNARLLPPLRERFKQLYHSKIENTIKKSNINRTLRGNVSQQPRTMVKAQRILNQSAHSSTNRSIHQINQNRNRNRTTQKMKRIKK